MNLPGLLVLTDRTLASSSLVSVVTAAVAAGARAIVLREKDLPLAQRLELAASIMDVLSDVGGVLILAGPHGDNAVHLAADDAFPTPRPSLVGRSCHSADEVSAAAAEGCDYVMVSPVFSTASKPGYGPALGLDALASLCRPDLPVYALGGVQPSDVAGCLAVGAAGVAVMGPIMRDPSIAAAYVAALPRWKVHS